MAANRRKVEAFAYQVSQSIAAAMNCSLAHVGDQLGLYQALSEAGPSTSDEFAARTGLHERWLREWLRHQACARQLEYEPTTDKFSISEEAQLVLCDKDSPYYFASGFAVYNVLQDAVKHLPEAFRTGLGLNYDDHGPACASGIESLNNYVPRFLLISTILPELDGVCERLDHGIKVADVGCGAGVALIQMAEEYPNSEFLGYEISQHALSRARENLREANVSNVEIIDVNDEPMPIDESFDLICTFDVVHDVPFPDRLLSDIRRALKPDGTWLCSDIRSFPTFEENLNQNPSAYLMYGFSMLVCMSSAMSEKNGAGLGTLGFNEQVAREMTAEAGFSRFRKLEYENATNSYYEIQTISTTELHVRKLAESVDQALTSEDADLLKDVVSGVPDWSAIPTETVDYVLKRIGMYGFSGRTDRYKTFAEMILNRGGDPSLFTCAMLKLNERAKRLLDRNSSLVRSVDETGNSALHYAALRGNLELATFLCEQDADVDALNADFESPVHLAAHAGPWKSEPATELVRLLLSHGATTSLQTLAVIGDEQAIREQMERKQIDVNELDRGNRTALFHAAHNNHLQVVQLLLDMGADPNLADRDGQTPLSSACLHMLSQECDPKIIDCLLAGGATKSLEAAIVTDDLSLVSEFIERDSTRLNGQDHESPLGYAIHVWRPKSLYRLLELGARPNASNWDHIERIAKDDQLVDKLRSVVS